MPALFTNSSEVKGRVIWDPLYHKALGEREGTQVFIPHEGFPAKAIAGRPDYMFRPTLKPSVYIDQKLVGPTRYTG